MSGTTNISLKTGDKIKGNDPRSSHRMILVTASNADLGLDVTEQLAGTTAETKK